MAGGDFGQGRHSPGLSSGPFAQAGSVVQPAASGPTTRPTLRMPRTRRRLMASTITEPSSTTGYVASSSGASTPSPIQPSRSASHRPTASRASHEWRCEREPTGAARAARARNDDRRGNGRRQVDEILPGTYRPPMIGSPARSPKSFSSGRRTNMRTPRPCPLPASSGTTVSIPI